MGQGNGFVGRKKRLKELSRQMRRKEMSREIPPAYLMTQEWLDKLEKRLEKLERGQAITQYMVAQIQDNSKKTLDAARVYTDVGKAIVEGIERWEKVLEEWDENHPLMGPALQFSEWLEKNVKFAGDVLGTMGKETK